MKIKSSYKNKAPGATGGGHNAKDVSHNGQQGAPKPIHVDLKDGHANTQSQNHRNSLGKQRDSLSQESGSHGAQTMKSTKDHDHHRGPDHETYTNPHVEHKNNAHTKGVAGQGSWVPNHPKHTSPASQKKKSLTEVVKPPKPGAHGEFEAHSDEEEVSDDEEEDDQELDTDHEMTHKLGKTVAEYALPHALKAADDVSTRHDVFKDDHTQMRFRLEKHLTQHPEFLDEYVVRHISPMTIRDWLCKAECEAHRLRQRANSTAGEERAHRPTTPERHHNEVRGKGQPKSADAVDERHRQSGVFEWHQKRGSKARPNSETTASELRQCSKFSKVDTEPNCTTSQYSEGSSREDCKPHKPPPVQLMFDTNGEVKVMTQEQEEEFKEKHNFDLTALECMVPRTICYAVCPPASNCPPSKNCYPGSNNGRRFCGPGASMQPRPMNWNCCARIPYYRQCLNTRRQASDFRSGAAIQILQVQGQALRTSDETGYEASSNINGGARRSRVPKFFPWM